MAVPSNVKLHAGGNVFQEQFIVPKNSHIAGKRISYPRSCKVNHFSPEKTGKIVSPHLRTLQLRPKSDTSMSFCCLSALTSAGAAVASDWIPIVDQVLLLASISLTYMAGVIPYEKSPFNTHQSLSRDYAVLENNSSTGSATANDGDVYLLLAWKVVQEKLVDSLSALESGINLPERLAEFERSHRKQPSSVAALAEGPRTRLLWASFQSLKNEVANISGDHATKLDSSAIFRELIQKCYQPLCMAWLEEELCLLTSKPDKALLSLVVSRLNGPQTLMQNIRKSGKENLYSELIYALRFGSSREGGYYNYSLFAQHGVAILEDLVITLGDGVASMYLELISVDSGLPAEMNNLGLNLCTLSTRALQKLRNEVALHQWLHQNMDAIVSMYEDQFDLLTLQRQLVGETSKNEIQSFNWLKKIGLRGTESMSSSLHFVVISHITIPVKRTTELRALNGWRYYFSLFLELADITMPFVRTVVAKVSDAISFFLVCLIGRSLGLIYSGIRQSLRWK